MFDVNGKDKLHYNVDNFEFIKKTSPIVGGLIEKNITVKKQCGAFASENYCSEAVLAACGKLSLVSTRRAILMGEPVIRAVTTEERNLWMN